MSFNLENNVSDIKNTQGDTSVSSTEHSWHRWLNPDQLALIYGISKSTQSKMRMASHPSNIPFSKIGKYIRYDRIAIDKWLEDHQVQGEHYAS